MLVPLEWGLGHATRCIPIINELILLDCEVLVAAEGSASTLLRKEFPDLHFLHLEGYRMKYSRRKQLLPLKILIQLPKIILSIYKENAWLKKAVKDHNIDAVISDNRFGMYCSSVPCFYITHQLLIKTGSSFTEKIAQRIHYHFIKKYKECWVPDFERDGLAGELSHPKKLPGKVKYIGALSRFELHNNVEKKYDMLVSISGPEPQRTIFEEQILKELERFSGTVLFIRGLPENKAELTSANSLIKIKNHLPASDLNKAILQSHMVVSRCGYTTVMDLVKLQKTAILVPTPGQTEQEYLAAYLGEKKLFYTMAQKNFKLSKALADIEQFRFTITNYNMEQYKIAINEFVSSL